jgi:hypothetical protein
MNREQFNKQALRKESRRSYWLGVVVGVLIGTALGFAIGYGAGSPTMVVVPLSEGVKV